MIWPSVSRKGSLGNGQVTTPTPQSFVQVGERLYTDSLVSIRPFRYIECGLIARASPFLALRVNPEPTLPVQGAPSLRQLRDRQLFDWPAVYQSASTILCHRNDGCGISDVRF